MTLNMVVFPNAKINIGLNIVEKRQDGYHNIESCFYPIPFTDALEVIESESLSFTSSGLPIPGISKENLCLKAYHLLKDQFDIPPVAIHLHKHIPIGAGLGGGSADGAFMIKLLNEKFALGIGTADLEKLANQLGSDCSFFIRNKPVFVEGTGNVFSDIDFSLEGKYMVLVMPEIHVSTASAYAGISPSVPAEKLGHLLKSSSLTTFQTTVKNNFESSVFIQHPELVKIKTRLISQGAAYASMTGSGSAIFGIFETAPNFSSEHEFQVFQF